MTSYCLGLTQPPEHKHHSDRRGSLLIRSQCVSRVLSTKQQVSRELSTVHPPQVLAAAQVRSSASGDAVYTLSLTIYLTVLNQRLV